MTSENQNGARIGRDKVTRKFKSMPDWTGAEPNNIQGFWLKSFTAIYEICSFEWINRSEKCSSMVGLGKIYFSDERSKEWFQNRHL